MPRPKDPTTNVSLTAHWRRFVQQRIKSGRYSSVSEVVRDGLRLIEERERDRDAELAGIKQAIELGWQQSQRGEMVSGPEVFDEIRRLSNSRRRKAS